MHTNAKTIEQAATATGEFRAGGTDLQERIRSGITGNDLIDIQGIPDLDQITYHEGGVSIGALATIADIGKSDRIQKEYSALAFPAQTLATPQIRNMATMAGALAQRTRCWYYRHPKLGCPKKGNAETCPARTGNHHFGVCFDFGPCVHPHPSSLACALLTYEAKVETSKRGKIDITDLYGDGSDPTRDHTLAADELITYIHLPKPAANEKAAYYRQMSREEAEWPLVEVVVRLLFDGDTILAARIGIGAVANIPFRLTEVEEALVGKTASGETLANAAKLAIQRATPLPQTEYKLPMVIGSVQQALEEAVRPKQ